MSTGHPRDARSATVDDAAGISAVHIASWQGAYAGLLPATYLDALSEPAIAAARTQQWAVGLREGRDVAVVEDAGGQVVAFAIVTPSRDADAAPGVGEVPAIYCHPTAWGQGYGSAVHDAALAHLTRTGHHEVTLWVLAANERARTFYVRQGWHVDHGPGGARQDHVAGVLVEEVRYRRALP